jgi:hypothetical protein
MIGHSITLQIKILTAVNKAPFGKLGLKLICNGDELLGGPRIKPLVSCLEYIHRSKYKKTYIGSKFTTGVLLVAKRANNE